MLTSWKAAAGIPMTLHTKAHRAYTDRIMKDMERGYPVPETTEMGRFAYWSTSVTTCLGLYLLARLSFLDLQGEPPYALAVTWQRLLTFTGLLLTLELVFVVVRKQAGGKRRILTAVLLLVGVAVRFPAFPHLPRFPAVTSLFRLNLLLFVLCLAAAMVSRKLEREKHSNDGR